MAAHSGSSSSVPSLPPPCPKSPPEYPDLYGKRREMAKVQVLEREISFLEEELKTVDRFHPASRSCKEVADFVVAKSDPLIPVNRKNRRSCRFWKWLCGTPCFNFSWLSWICCCCYSKCSIHIELPRCCDCSDCSICCCRPCTCCSIPKCWCWSCPKSCPRSRCCRKVSCSRDCCCIFRLPSCLDCSCCCQWKCPSLKCPKVPLHCSCKSNCLHCSCKRNCCTCNPCSLFF
ncbi:hypothetical protein AB3S75_017943 [Citrus x aurantiifolia]